MKNQVLQPDTFALPLTGLTIAVLLSALAICLVSGLFPWPAGIAGAANLEFALPMQSASIAAQNSLFDQILGAQPYADHAMRGVKSLLSFALSAVLAALLAFRPQQKLSHFKRDPLLAQTQMLLAVVGTALMIVVADSAARAFGIFAAASLIRFRTNIRNPKEITVLLVSLAVGLASGVGRWEIAIALTCFVLLLLWPLERFEISQLSRAMELEVKTNNFNQTDAVLRKIFKRYRIDAELREADGHSHKNESSVILYFLELSPHLSTDRISQEIFKADGSNIESVKWEQKKSALLFER